MNCKKCGNTIIDDTKFCPKCGTPINENNIQTNFNNNSQQSSINQQAASVLNNFVPD